MFAQTAELLNTNY